MKVPIEFISQNYTIRGKFYSTEGKPPFPTVLLLTGMPGNEDDVLGLGQTMSQHGINTVTFNYRGTHQSEGTCGWRNTLEDIHAAMEYLHQEEIIREFQIDTDRLILGGYCYGGAMALAFAISHLEIKRIFSIAGTDQSECAREYMRNPAFAQMVDTLLEELKFPAGPVHFKERKVMKELTQNPDPYDLKLGATALTDRDILLIGGWNDPDSTIEHHILPLYRALENAGAQQVRIVAFQDSHEFEECREELAWSVVRWVKSL